MVLYVACFGVSFFVLFSPSMCLDDIKLGLGSFMATFWERATYAVNHILFVLSL